MQTANILAGVDLLTEEDPLPEIITTSPTTVLLQEEDIMVIVEAVEEEGMEVTQVGTIVGIVMNLWITIQQGMD